MLLASFWNYLKNKEKKPLIYFILTEIGLLCFIVSFFSYADGALELVFFAIGYAVILFIQNNSPKKMD